jgi:hypothetical protein
VVGAPGFGPGTSCAQGRRATRLRYAPTIVPPSYSTGRRPVNIVSPHKPEAGRDQELPKTVTVRLEVGETEAWCYTSIQ